MDISVFSHLPQWKDYHPEHNLLAIEEAVLSLRGGGSRLAYVAAVFIQEKHLDRPQASLLVSDQIDANGCLREAEVKGARGYFEGVSLDDIIQYKHNPIDR